jgi:hypothetical protein
MLKSDLNQIVDLVIVIFVFVTGFLSTPRSRHDQKRSPRNSIISVLVRMPLT